MPTTGMECRKLKNRLVGECRNDEKNPLESIREKIHQINVEVLIKLKCLLDGLSLEWHNLEQTICALQYALLNPRHNLPCMMCIGESGEQHRKLSLPCGHVCCEPFIIDRFSNCKKCPICEKNIKIDQLWRVYCDPE
ncbi:uncharacterized protein LOC116805992 isoform X2 [Drosophila grimshawi]|uniref:uncharacterized protein LOC116805992 isoform X2 n=1 Tax=Drosophila grimshawi TaxID=7222 RepID=UPI000C87076E|nr:uncharacterized protein LOC116805992 isoform X2 [Drosophila grimshawi]